MPQNYTPEFKKKIIRLRLEEGRTIHSITTEYGISKESIRLKVYCPIRDINTTVSTWHDRSGLMSVI